MSLPSKRYKQEIKFVIIFIDKYGITLLTTTIERQILEDFL